MKRPQDAFSRNAVEEREPRLINGEQEMGDGGPRGQGRGKERMEVTKDQRG
jgi:hypothetical protein